MTNNSSTELENIEQLLPWYATGKLQNGERLEVESALEQFPELRKQLEIIRGEITQTIASNEAVAMPRADAAKRFMALLPRESKPGTAGQTMNFKSLKEWLTAQLAGTPRWAVVAGVMAIVLQSGVIGALLFERPTGGYHTATGGAGQVVDGTLVLARFTDTANLAVVAARLAALDITIVDGPKAGGMFTLRIGPDQMPVVDRDRKTAALKAATDIVLFVGPVQ